MARPRSLSLRSRRVLRAAVGSTAAVAAVAGLTAFESGADAATASVRDAAVATATPVALTAADIMPSDAIRTAGSVGSTGSTVSEDIADRSISVSRSDARAIADYEASSQRFVRDPAREAVLSTGTSGVAIEVEEDLTQQDPRSIARQLMPEYGMSSSQFGCLDALWVSESDWNMYADNPTSSAYGIPQALMSAWDLPADYTTNPVTQIEWGLWYIRATYGDACSAWSFKQANNWY